MREFFVWFLKAHKTSFHYYHYLSSIILSNDLSMTYITTTDSRASTPTMDTEEGSIISGTPAGANGKRRSTPFDNFLTMKLMEEYEVRVFNEFVAYNEKLSLSKCVHRVQPRRLGQSKEKQCTCLHVLQQESSPQFCEAIAEYQVYFGGSNRRQKQMIVIEWIRCSQLYNQDEGRFSQAGNSSLLFPIPFIVGEDEGDCSTAFNNLKAAKICRDALMDLLGVAGKEWWLTCIKHGLNNTVPDFKLKGRKPNNKRRWDEMYFDSLVEDFEELRKEAIPKATRFVREKTGETTTRDAKDKVECIASDLSERQCYAK
jgi:hypothetical protein